MIQTVDFIHSMKKMKNSNSWRCRHLVSFSLTSVSDCKSISNLTAFLNYMLPASRKTNSRAFYLGTENRGINNYSYPTKKYAILATVRPSSNDTFNIPYQTCNQHYQKQSGVGVRKYVQGTECIKNLCEHSR